METPQRGKTGGASLSKFEDSPVFNFINNLSPIRPVKSTDSAHIPHTYQSLNFASLSSIFSSPHANPPRVTRNLTGPPSTDLSRREEFLENVGESSLCSEVSDVVRPSRFTATTQDNCNITCSFNEAAIDPPEHCPILPSTLPQSSQYDSGSPDHNTKMKFELDLGHAPAELVPFVQNDIDRRKILFTMEAGVQENHPLELNKDEVEGVQENLIFDDAEDMLIFDSFMEPVVHERGGEEVIGNDVTSFVSLLSNYTENVDQLQKTQPDIPHGPCVQDITQDLQLKCSEDSRKKKPETEHGKKMLSVTHQNQVDDHKQHGIHRRCLVFEVAGISQRNIYGDSSHNQSTTLPSKSRNIFDANLKPAISPSLCAFPGIGLHLNALATTSMDRMVKNETLAPGKQLITMPCPIDPFASATTGRNSPQKSLAIEADLLTSGEIEDLQVTYDAAAKDISLGNCEELSQGSPKKKRCKSENGGESEGCKRCNCKKSKCLKLYCECFAAGVYCSEPCSCQGCFNKPIHEDTVLATRKQIESRNPLAFAPKVIRTSEAGVEMRDDANKTPASTRHKRGCNCKKSNCLKKYCECYQFGVGCSISCRCEGCKNAFGRKEGECVGEIEHVEEETDAYDKEKEGLDDGPQIAKVQIDERNSFGNILPITPHQSCRRSIKLPSSSSAKPPRVSKLSIGRSPGLYGSHILWKSEILLSQDKSENKINANFEDDTPTILKSNASPTTGIKIASPNRKRVSPPHIGVGLSPPNRRSCRKLILKSIPPFPSLDNDDASTEHPLSYSCNSSFSSSTVN
ncbi:unnamed protein product [Musa acuminata var. zebrina]